MSEPVEQGPAYVGEMSEVRVSPDRMRVARRIPDAFLRLEEEEVMRWVETYFTDGVGLTVALRSDEDVVDWIVLPVE